MLDKGIAANSQGIGPGRGLDPGALLYWAVQLYLGLGLLGFALLRLLPSAPAGNELTSDRALFLAFNSLTLCGFPSTVNLNDLFPVGVGILVLLSIAGIFLATVFPGILIVRLLGLPFSTRQIIQSAIFWLGGLVLAGGLILMAGGETAKNAFMLSMSALGNSGLYLGRLPGITSWQTHLVLLPLAVLGSLGLPVFMELLSWRTRVISFYTRTVLFMTALVYLAGTLLCLLTLFPANQSLEHAAIASSVWAINTRSAGFPFEMAGGLPRTTQWLMMLLMLIGGSPGGTAGGIKTTAVYELVRGINRCLSNQSPGRMFGITLCWIGAYSLSVFLIFLALLASQSQIPADRLLFETLSAMGHAGLAFDPIMMVGWGLHLLWIAMLIGKILPLLMLAWALRSKASPADLATA